MASEYLFDTGFLTLALTDCLPERWIRPWNEIREQQKVGYIIEPVIAETYYQLMVKNGIDKKSAKNYIIEQVKSCVTISGLDDNDCFLASLYRIKFRKFGLSLVDCFILAIAYRRKLKIYTTDEPLKKAAKEIKVLCDYLPV